jgi:S-methylmethionine-dependent homocysteine/selenocysteine methylase
MDAYEEIGEALGRGRPIVIGGPMGPELVRRGVRWRGHGMLTDAEAVGRLYQEYSEAGAQVVRTNTFQLNRRIYLDVFRDEQHMRHIGAPGLERRAVELTRKAVELAREARARSGRDDVAIAGVMAPLEHCFRPDLAPDTETAKAEHTELARTLADAGVDLLLLESMNTLAEARAAAAAADATGLPFWASFVLGPDGCVLGGDPLAGAARAMREMGAQAVLVDSIPPSEVAGPLGTLAPTGPTGASPMVGKYDPPSWKFEFFPQFCESDAWPPERLSVEARRWIAAGARIVGSAGGSGPAHTRALAEMVT